MKLLGDPLSSQRCSMILQYRVPIILFVAVDDSTQLDEILCCGEILKFYLVDQSLLWVLRPP